MCVKKKRPDHPPMPLLRDKTVVHRPLQLSIARLVEIQMNIL